MKYMLADKSIDVRIDKEVDLEIGENDFKELKYGGWGLYLARMVNKTFNVVWQSCLGEDFTELNQFGWEPVYHIFGTKYFRSGAKVKANVRSKEIRLGETIFLESNGALGKSFKDGPKDSIVLKNDFGSMHIAISQVSIGADGLEKLTPIYVDPEATLKGQTTVLTPVDEVRVWLQKGQEGFETGTMYSDIDFHYSMSTDIDLTNVAKATRSFIGEEWRVPK